MRLQSPHISLDLFFPRHFAVFLLHENSVAPLIACLLAFISLRMSWVVLVAILVIGILVMFHLGGIVALRAGQLAPLLGAFLGGGLVLINVALPTAHTGARDWKGRERISWVLMGIGIVAWGIGEAIWRSSVSPGRSSFPSFANSGYALFPLLAFVSLLLKPSFPRDTQRGCVTRIGRG